MATSRAHRIGIATLAGLSSTALVLGAITSASAAAPGFWQTVKASVTSAGASLPASSRYGDVSANGRYVVFQSDADLTTESFSTNPGFTHVYRRDLQTDTTVLVSVNTAGNGVGNFDSTRPTISADGCRVAWVSTSSDLVSPTGSFNAQIYVRDLCSPSTLPTTLVTFAPGGARGDSGSSLPQISDDGMTVVYSSNSGNLLPSLGDNNGAADIYASSISASGVVGSPQIVSVSDAETASSGALFPSVSADGNLVAFSTTSAWVPAAPVFYQVWIRNRSAGTTTLVSTQSGSALGASGDTQQSILSADGTHIAFLSTASNVVASDPNGSGMSAFVHDIAANSSALVDVSSAGIQGDAVAGSDLGISSTGRFVLFSSGAHNFAADTDVAYDRSYVRDTEQHTTALVGATGADTVFIRPTYPIGLSADGGIAAFYSLANGATIGSNFDVYVRNIAKTPTSTTLGVAPSSIVAGAAAPTLTAQVTSGVAGSVQFFEGTTSLGTSSVSGGVATMAGPSGLTVGSHSFTAVFTPTVGERTGYSVSSTAGLTVTAAPPTGGSGSTPQPTETASPGPTPEPIQSPAQTQTQTPVVPKAQSTVKVTGLPKKASIATKKLRLATKVVVAGTAAPSGRVTVKINGKTVATKKLSTTGTAVITLPTLKSLKKSKKLTGIVAGKKITLTVGYLPALPTAVAASSAKPVKVRLAK